MTMEAIRYEDGSISYPGHPRARAEQCLKRRLI